MHTKRKLAIFDFCGTLFKHQSADMYVDFASEKNLRNNVIDRLCAYLLTKPKYSGLIHKKVKLLKLKGLTEKKLQEQAASFIDQIIRPGLIDVVMETLGKYASDPGFDVVIASAGYDTYLKEFCSLYNVRYLAATELEINSGTATGRMHGYDCFGKQKVVKLKTLLDLTAYDLDNSVCYSDSLTDKPIFELVGVKYFIKESNNNYSIIHIDNEVFTIL